MVIHTYEQDQDYLVTLATYGSVYLLVTICDGDIDSQRLPNLKEALAEYRMAVSRVKRASRLRRC